MLQSAQRRLIAWVKAQDAMHRLWAIEDRLLTDMGIRRRDIASRVHWG